MASSTRGRHRPSTLKNIHKIAQSSYLLSGGLPAEDELLQHSRYIREYLTPLVISNGRIPESETDILPSIMQRLGTIPINLSLLRYSRIERALFTIAEAKISGWPVEVAQQAKYILQKWKIGLGQDLMAISADLLGPGGGLDGLRCIAMDSSWITDPQAVKCFLLVRSKSGLTQVAEP